MRIAIIGRTRMLLKSAERLAAENHRIVCVIACDAAPDYGGTVADFEQLAVKHGAPFLFTTSLELAEARQSLIAARPDCGVSAGWPTRIPETAQALFPCGILNIHGGDLPRYRGNAPFAWAILSGETQVGITVHLMDNGLDSGPILAKAHVPLTTDTYIGDLYKALDRHAPELFSTAVNGIERKSLTPQPQAGIPLTGYSRRPEDGAIRWTETAFAIRALVRASAEPLGGAYCSFNDQRLRVWRARVERLPMPETYAKPTRLAVPGQVVTRNDASVAIHCGGSEALILDTVQTVNDAERAPAASVIRSMRDRLHDG